MVAFSEQDYPVGDDQEEGATLGKVEGKPGIKKKNLWLIALLLLMLLFADACGL